MEMTEAEIRKSYREAANPQKQVVILAQLNQCSREEISRIVDGAVAPIRMRTEAKFIPLSERREKGRNLDGSERAKAVLTVCYRCGTPIPAERMAKGRRSCGLCRKTQAEYDVARKERARQRRRWARENGFCTTCGAKLEEGEKHVQCFVCRQKNTLAQKEYNDKKKREGKEKS